MADELRSEVGDVPRMPIREFMDGGYLQEVNRRILHPCGLALEVEVAAEPAAVVTLTRGGVEALRELIERVRAEGADWAEHMDELEARLDEAELLEPGDGRLSGVWDCRWDAEGVIFGAGVVDAGKARRVTDEMTHRGLAREASLGYVVQPADGLEETTPLPPAA